MSEKLPVNNFEWIKDISKSNGDFIKNYNKEIDEGYLLEDGVQYLEKLHDLHNDSPFLPKRMKSKKFGSLLLSYMIRLNVLFT